RFDERHVVVRLHTAAGTSLPEMDRLTGLVGDDVRAIAGVGTVAAHVGRAIASDQVVDVDSGDLWITIDPDADDEAVLSSIQRTVAGYPGVSARLQTYPNQQVDDRIGAPEDPVVVRVFGQDLGILHDRAEQIRTAIANVDGVADPRVEPQVVEPT